MTKKKTHKALSLFLALLMCLSLIPSMGITALAADALEPVAAGTEAIKDYLDGQEEGEGSDYYEYVYYGGLKWRVLDGEADSGNGTGMLLLSENVLNHDTTNLGQPYNGFRTNSHPTAANYMDTSKGYAASDVRKYLTGEGTYSTFQTARTKGNDEVAYNYIANVMYYQSVIEDDPNDSIDEFDAGPQAGVTYYVIDTENYVQETETLNSGTFQHGAYYTLSGGKYTRAYTYDPSATYYYDASTYKVWSGTAFEAGQTYYRFYQATANLNAAQNNKILGTLYYVGYKINKARIISGFSASDVNFVTDFGISDIEKAAVLPATKAATPSAQTGDYKYYGGPLYNDAYFLLSATEANDPDYGMHLQANRVGNRLSGGAAHWWLRSSSYAVNAGNVYTSGVFSYSSSYNYGLGVRPAFYLNPTSVLFASESAAAGGKSGAVGAPANFSNFASANTQTWKLTMLDSSLSVTAGTPTVNGNVVTLPYSGASTYGDNVYLSAIVTDGAGEQIYGYAKLARIDSAAARSGSVEMELPTASVGGTDTQLTLNNCVIKVFLERCGDETETDYASTPTAINTPSCTGGHTYSVWEYPDDFDCAVGGTRTRYCLLCGEEESDTVAASSHTLHQHYAVAKSCKNGNGGIEAYWECEVCGRLFRDAAATQEVASLNDLLINEAHNTASVYHVASDAHFHYYNTECLEADCGLITVNRSGKQYWEAHTGVNCATGGTCSLCDATVAAGEHTFRTNDASTFVRYLENPNGEPICTDDDLEAIYKCAICGEEGAVKVGAQGHLYSGQVMVRTVNYDQTGVLYQYCVRCGEPKTSEIALYRTPATIVITGEQSFVNLSGAAVTAAADNSGTFKYEHYEADDNGDATEASGLVPPTNYTATVKWYSRDSSGSRTALGSAPSGIGTYSLGVSASIANTTELDTNGNAVKSYLAVDEVFYDFEIVAPNGDNYITGFVVPNQVGQSEINHSSGTITITMPWNTSDADLKAITPSSVTVSENATLVTPTNWNTAQDFTVSGGVQYKVRSQSGDEKTYWVSVVRDSGARTVSFDTAGGSTHAFQTVTIGQAYGTLPEPTKTGFVFEGWYLENGNQSGTDFETLIESTTTVTVETDHTLYAKWRELKLLIPQTETQEYSYDGTAKSYLPMALIYDTDPAEYLQATASDDKSFVVTYKGENDTSFSSTAPSAVGTYEVKFTRPADDTYSAMTAGTGTLIITPSDMTVTFAGGDHGSVSSTSATILYGEKIDTVPTVTEATGWKFIGWECSLNAGVLYSDNAVKDYVVTEDVTFTAQYAAKNNGVIIYNYDGGTDSSGASYSKYEGAAGTAFTAPSLTVTKPGYTFDEWDSTPSVYPGEGEVTTVTAKWTEKSVTVKFAVDDDEHGFFESNAVTTKSVKTGEAVGAAPTVTADNGWTFTGYWTCSAGGALKTADIAAYVLSGDYTNDTLTFTAQFTQNGKTAVIYDYNGGKDSDGNSHKKWEGVAGTAFQEELPTITRDGYTLTAPQTPEIYPDEGAEVIVASWTAKNYTIKYNKNNDDATGTTRNQSATYDANVTLTSNGYTLAGSEFKGWATSADGEPVYADGATVKNLTTGTEITLYAVWETKDITVTFNAGGGVWATDNSTVQTVTGKAGGTLTKPADPTRTGYTFSGWEGSVPDTIPTVDTTYTAKWTANTYKVSFNANGGTGSIADQSFTYDQEQALSANNGSITREGWHFLGWATSEQGGVTYGDGAAVKNLTSVANGTVTLYAVWSEDSYSITYDYAGGSVESSNPSIAKTGETVTLANKPTRDGYEFAGWTSNEAQINNEGKFTMPAKNVTITATWRAVTYTIEYKTSEANATGRMSAQTVTFGTEDDALTANGFAVVGKTFRGWATEEGGEIKYANKAAIDPDLTTTKGATVTLYAVFSADSFAIIYDYDGGTIEGTNENLFLAKTDDKVTLKTEPTREGYTFAGWTSEDVSITSNGFTMPGKNVTVKATWTADEHTVTYVMPHTDKAGENITETATTDANLAEIPASGVDFNADDGYIFNDQWICSEGGTFTLADMAKYVMPAKDVTFTAVVVSNTQLATDRTLTFDAGEGKDAPAPITAEKDSVVSLSSYTATAPEGKLFDGWADESGEKITSVTMDTDKTVYAQYKDDTSVDGQFTVTFEAGENGAFIIDESADPVDSYEIKVDKEQTIADMEDAEVIEPTANENYVFLGWAEIDSNAIIPTAAVSKIAVKNDVTYIAIYQKTGPIDDVVYTLSFDAGEGSYAPSSITMPKDTTVSLDGLTATAPEGKTFEGWTLDGRDVTSVTLDGDKTVVAKYSDIVKYDVTFEVGENGTTSDETAYEVVSGESVETVPVVMANDGFTFLGWTIGSDATVYTNEAVKAMVITKDTTFTAKYNDNSEVDPESFITLTFDAETNGGSGAPAAIKMPSGTKISLMGYMATPPENKVFDGWFAAAEGGNALSDYTFGDEDGTVYAQYSDEPETKTFTVKFFDKDGNELDNRTVNEGECVTGLPAAPTVSNMIFTGWKDATGSVYTASGIENRPVTADVDYTAYYMTDDPAIDPATFKTLSFDAGVGKDAPAAMTLPTGTKVSLTGLTATAPTGRTFNGWKLNGTLVTEVTLDDNITLVASYTTTNPAGPFTVTFFAGTNGKMTPETHSESVIGGNTVTSVPTITANNSYTFEGWTLNGGSTKYSSADVAAMKITEDCDFVAYYSKTTVYGGGGGETTTTYTLSYQSNGGTNYSNETYTSGTTATLDKVPTRDGYTFTGWYSDAALTNRITSIQMDGNKTVYAGWKESGDIRRPTPSPYLNYEDHMAFVDGYPDGTFGPNKNITRAESATMIYRLLTDARKSEIMATTNSFSDVDSSKWYNIYVSSMAKGEYVNGYPDGTFGGEKDITRAEFVTLLVRFFDPATASISFKDVSSGHWAYQSIVTAYAYGWINGYEDGTFRPDQPITRAEAVAIINRILGRGIDADSTLGDFKNFSDNTDTNKWYYYEIIEAANSHEYTGERPSENWTRITE